VSHRAGVVSKYRSKVKRGKGGKKVLAYLEVLLRDPCVYCGEMGSDSIDHIVPVIKYERAKAEDSRDHWTNLAPCHAQCNVRKGSMNLVEFFMYKGVEQA
jgi:5-methylcytosine-specific restriction endonuclease McrA